MWGWWRWSWKCGLCVCVCVDRFTQFIQLRRYLVSPFITKRMDMEIIWTKKNIKANRSLQNVQIIKESINFNSLDLELFKKCCIRTFHAGEPKNQVGL